MKKKFLLYSTMCAALAMTSCQDFLDTMPDNRAEVDSADKITALLVSAYPQSTHIVMTEMSSDNAMDNGSRYDVEDQAQEEAYLWEDITSVGNDSPQNYWDACYAAVAAANQALQAINDMGNPASLSAQRGEALMCRAYGHFALADMFCLPYNPETASTDLGLPYSMAPETQVAPHYERGTMEELYQKINDDIEEALPLISDDLYSVPKYHFNRKAAYAFAARFNLYYKKFEKVIEYANVVLGNTPTSVLRDWNAINNSPANVDTRANMYIDADEAANLLLFPVISSWGYWGGNYYLGERYGHANAIFNNETARAAGLWGAYSNLIMSRAVVGMDTKNYIPKMGIFFEFTDKVNGIGYRRTVTVAFSTDETLLCRAEAYALQNDLSNATADINAWLYTHTLNQTQCTQEEIVDFYENIDYMPTSVTDDSQRTIKKRINPQGFTVTEGAQENIIQCILHLRRLETLYEGLRWQDIKRYGIEIAHNREGMADDILTVDDPRRAIQLPADVIDAGLEPNPRN